MHCKNPVRAVGAGAGYYPGDEGGDRSVSAVAEIRSAFRRLFTLSMHHAPFLPASAVETSSGWLDILHDLQPLMTEPDPGRLLRRLMTDGEFRCRFLFALFLPSRYGGAFGRYPRQASFLQEWLRKMNPQGPLCCLDAACGSGEGTYELALLLQESGFPSEQLQVQGMTIEPLEVFAAAHAWFPHDPARQGRYRHAVRQAFPQRAADRYCFQHERSDAPITLCSRSFTSFSATGFSGVLFCMNGKNWRKRSAASAASLKQGESCWQPIISMPDGNRRSRMTRCGACWRKTA